MWVFTSFDVQQRLFALSRVIHIISIIYVISIIFEADLIGLPLKQRDHVDQILTSMLLVMLLTINLCGCYRM